MTQKHTPTPWSKIGNQIQDESGWPICDLIPNPKIQGEMGANGDRIVKAINAHDEVVKVLADIAGAFGHPDTDESQSFWGTIATNREYAETADAEFETRPDIVKQRLVEKVRAILAKVQP